MATLQGWRSERGGEGKPLSWAWKLHRNTKTRASTSKTRCFRTPRRSRRDSHFCAGMKTGRGSAETPQNAVLWKIVPVSRRGGAARGTAGRPAETLSPSMAPIYNLILKSESPKHINLSDPGQRVGYLLRPLLFFQAGLNFPGCWKRGLSRGLQEHLVLKPVTLSYGFSIN